MAMTMNLFRVCIILLKVMKVSGVATLSPSGTLFICPKQLFVLRCQTTEPFQQWSITVPEFRFSERRLISAYGVPEIIPLRSNYINFNFTRNSVSPVLEASLVIINATENLEVSCVEYTGSPVTSVDPSLRAAINLINIHGYPHLPATDLNIIEELFYENNVTTILNYEDVFNSESQYGITLNVSIQVTPQVTLASNGTHVELVLLYNILYNITSFVSLCGSTGPRTTGELFYGACRHLSTNSKLTNYLGHSDPALEGTTVFFSCPPDLVLIGPNSSVCMRNGEWDPDPREVACKANCNVPTHPSNGYILPYTNTIEAVRLQVLCFTSTENGLQRENITTVVCTSEGSWDPNPLSVCKNSTGPANFSPNVTAPIASNNNVIEITVASSVAVSVIFFIAGALCMKLFRSKTVKDQSEDALDTTAPTVKSQMVPVYESLQVSVPKNGYDLKENVAYGHVAVRQYLV